MTIPALIPSSAVEINSGRPVTTSLAVAEIFEKRHDNVLQSIDEMECSPGFRALNFQESFRETPTGNGAVRRFRTVQMTKDGFTILAMGYTGAKAMRFKEAYIQRFNAQLQAPQPTLTDRLRSSRFLLSFDPAGSMLLQEVPDRAVLVDPDNLASLIGDSASLFSKSLLPRMVNASAVHARPLAPIPPMDNAREGVIAYLRGCKYGLPKRSLTHRVWACRSLTAIQREQLIHDLIEEGILQEVTYKTGTRSGTRLVLTGIRYHG